jgi:predicted nucleic acid-binding protein
MDWIEQWVAFPCQAIDHQLVRIAIERSERFRISYWDGAILAAAEALGSTVIYSEDLNDRQKYGAVRVVNPFR